MISDHLQCVKIRCMLGPVFSHHQLRLYSRRSTAWSSQCSAKGSRMLLRDGDAFWVIIIRGWCQCWGNIQYPHGPRSIIRHVHIAENDLGLLSLLIPSSPAPHILGFQVWDTVPCLCSAKDWIYGFLGDWHLYQLSYICSADVVSPWNQDTVGNDCS